MSRLPQKAFDGRNNLLAELAPSEYEAWKYLYLSDAKIAQALGVPRVTSRLQSARRKWGVDNRIELLLVGLQLGYRLDRSAMRKPRICVFSTIERHILSNITLPASTLCTDLSISYKHLLRLTKNLKEKLGARTRAELILMAVDLGFVVIS